MGKDTIPFGKKRNDIYILWLLFVIDNEEDTFLYIGLYIGYLWFNLIVSANLWLNRKLTDNE
ncbi:hypothetical protein DWW10_09910 [Bacteroides intestinalis]|uniref:Uncharacterized protein n=1 Tax=Bacteroides intestinalis TaxID=329854 RepID=A0A412YBD2_9BACE|nr:hypothetical protein DWW10_09910 [Bacteroides intestinalis]RHA62737.1 hypothetical protein DW932_03455 [Bacteroides intestinalis]